MQLSKQDVFKVLTDARVRLMYDEDFYLVDVKPGSPSQIRVEMAIGSNIPRTLGQMCEVLKVAHMNISFHKKEFVFVCLANGVEVTITKDMSADEAGAQWKDAMEARRIAYEASPEYKKRQEETAKRAVEEQAKADELLSRLDDVLHDKEKLPLWLSEFIPLGDSIHVNFDKAELADKLESAGYVKGEFVGTPPDEFNDEMKMRWAIGQGIDMLRMGMPIHPALADRVLGQVKEKPPLGPKPEFN